MFITLSLIDGSRHDEDTGNDVETTKTCVVNTGTIRCFYARRDRKPGTRITFNDGGGFAVSETPEAVAALVATGDLRSLAPVPPTSES